jgi:epsilon-lactone hydrolase
MPEAKSQRVWDAHGFAGSIGTLKASAQAVDAIGMFLRERLKVGVRNPL